MESISFWVKLDYRLILKYTIISGRISDANSNLKVSNIRCRNMTKWNPGLEKCGFEYVFIFPKLKVGTLEV